MVEVENDSPWQVSLTSLPSRVYGQQVFFDKFLMLLNIYLMSRPPLFVKTIELILYVIYVEVLYLEANK
jgi:hypothetical protein